MKRHCFLGLVVDRATKHGAETGMGLSMFKGKVVVVHKLELVDHEPKSPGDVFGPEELGRCVRLRGKGHVCRKLMQCAVLYSVSSCLACQRFDLGS